MRVFSIHAMNTMNKNIIFIKYEDFVIDHSQISKCVHVVNYVDFVFKYARFNKNIVNLFSPC